MDILDEPDANPVDLSGPGVPSLAQSWRRCSERLRAELGEDIFNSWFGRIELEAVSSGQARLSVPTQFLKSWIDTHYLGQITAALNAEIGSLAKVVDFRPLVDALRAADKCGQLCAGDHPKRIHGCGSRAKSIHSCLAAPVCPSDVTIG